MVDSWRERQRDVLVELRGRRTQDEIAVLAGLKFWRYVGLETGKVDLTSRELARLATAHEISPEDLAGRLGMLIDDRDEARLQAEIRCHLRRQLADGGVDDDEIADVLSELRGIPLTLESATRIGAIVLGRDRSHPRQRVAR